MMLYELTMHFRIRCRGRILYLRDAHRDFLDGARNIRRSLHLPAAVEAIPVDQTT